MLKKTITYETYDGQSVTEDFYFNLNKAELVELEVSESDGFGETLKKLVTEEDSRKILEMFKQIILLSIGRRSEDGKRFIKSDEIREEFTQTEAYSELFMELAGDAEAASAFVRGILPANLPVAEETEDVPLPPEPVKDPASMSREELVAAFKTRIGQSE